MTKELSERCKRATARGWDGCGPESLRRSALVRRSFILIAAFVISGCAQAMEWANAPPNDRLPNGRCRNPNDPTTTIECKQDSSAGTTNTLTADKCRADQANRTRLGLHDLRDKNPQAAHDCEQLVSRDTVRQQDANRSIENTTPALRSRLNTAQRVAIAAGRTAPGDQNVRSHVDRALQKIDDNELNENEVATVEFEAHQAAEAATDAKKADGAAKQEDEAQRQKERHEALAAAGTKCAADVKACETDCVAKDDPFLCTALAACYFEGACGANVDARKSELLFKLVCEELGEQVGCIGREVARRKLEECQGKDCTRYCRAGFTIACDQLCKTGDAAACSRGGPDSRALAARRTRVMNLPPLFARCLANRSKLEVLRVTGIRAARAGDRKAADDANAKLQTFGPEWSETLDLIREGIDLTTTNADGERDQKKYGALMRQFVGCSCEPTPSGRCR